MIEELLRHGVVNHLSDMIDDGLACSIIAQVHRGASQTAREQIESGLSQEGRHVTIQVQSDGKPRDGSMHESEPTPL